MKSTHEQRRKILREVVIGEVDDMGDKAKKIIREEVSFDQGGTNWFTGNVKQRGYYLHISPLTINPRGLTTMRLLGSAQESGICALIEAAPRFNARRLAEIQPSEEILEKCRARVYPQPAATPEPVVA